MAARWLYSPQRSISTSTNLYDADGSLLLRHSPDTTTLFAGDEEITLKKDATSADGVRYISLAGETVAAHSSDDHFTYLIPDRQGTGTMAIDSQTQQVTRRQYKPLGETRDQTGTWTGGQRGYTGGTQDDNTGLTNLGAREYDPSIGRFLSPDPLLDTAALAVLDRLRLRRRHPGHQLRPDPCLRGRRLPDSRLPQLPQPDAHRHRLSLAGAARPRGFGQHAYQHQGKRPALQSRRQQQHGPRAG